jgi:hypothetical protein
MYEISSTTVVLSDSPQHVDFHIQSGDYFAFLATMMGFIEEALNRCESHLVTEEERTAARSLRHELRYVQANYTITPRQLVDVQVVRGGGDQLVRR